MQQHRNQVSFFCRLPAYVVIHEGDDGDVRVAGEQTEQGRAVLCFLSPIDAMIEAAHYTSLGPSHRVMVASEVDRRLFRDTDGRGLIAEIHLGWPSLNGRILLRQCGILGRCTRTMHHWSRDPVTFEVDPIALANFAQYRELAGLFAWRETHTNLLTWSDMRLQKVVARATESMELLRARPSDYSKCAQIALFDPEFEQWHIVPFTGTPDDGRDLIT
jgi:hypothetical protein